MRHRRRRWSLEEKHLICRETLAPGISVARVARRHGLNTNQLFNWLRDPRFTPDASSDERFFLPVEVSQAAPCVPAGSPDASRRRVLIEISGGHRVVAESGYDPERLGRLLKAWLS